MGINTYDVLEAAGTKWNFLKFSPGLVGGHCIGVDPYYLTHKAEALGYEAKVISASRYINDHMAKNVARRVIMHVLRNAPDVNGAKVLVRGVTFKENVSDIRNSKIIDTVKEIQDFNIRVDIEDPYAEADEVYEEYGLHLSKSGGKDYDAVVIAIPHLPYTQLTEENLCAITKPSALIADLKGIFRGKITKREYWSL
jgi:UDP-N-acetyl-D-galactosamine dehydrogenase